ncbi:MAG: pilus assembly protein TadG-related protein [Salinarimonas sp.]
MPVIGKITSLFRAPWRKRLRKDTAGSVAIVAALSLPLLAGVAGLAVDLSRMTMTKASLQSIADHLALSGAREMQLRQRDLAALEAYLEARGRDYLDEQGLIADISAVIDPREHSVRIVFEGYPETIFIKAFQGERSAVSVEAVAMSVGGEYPLCLVTLDESAQHSMQFSTRTRVNAPGCAFYANSTNHRAVHIQGNSRLEAALVCAAGGIATTGAFTSSAHRETDCPPLADPLRSRVLPEPGPCIMDGRNRISDRRILDPGTYCGVIELRPGADIELRPGNYVFAGALRIFDGARLAGDEVNLHFHGVGPDHDIVLNVGREAHIALSAPRSGSMAGLLLTGQQPGGGHQRYYFGSAHAPVLTGTIYLPDGHFSVGSGVTIADRSPFTIIVARRFTLQQGPELSFEGETGIVLNTDYHLSDVPIPPGLGPNGGSIVLTR